MAVTIESGDCADVRSLIDINLTEDALPSSVILRPIYAGEAVTYVTSKFATIAQPSEARLKIAALYYCAYLLVTNITQLKQERLSGGEQTYQTYNPEMKAMELRRKADEIILEVRATDVDDFYRPHLPPFFTLASAGKNRHNL